MNRKTVVTIGIVCWLAALAAVSISAEDKYAVRVRGGLSMAEFKGVKVRWA